MTHAPPHTPHTQRCARAAGPPLPGFSSLLVVEASKKLLSEGIFFVFALEDSKVDTLNYRFLVKLGTRISFHQSLLFWSVV
jgi:hypothetical protein